jgi:hypothetical protein
LSKLGGEVLASRVFTESETSHEWKFVVENYLKQHPLLPDTGKNRKKLFTFLIDIGD